MSSLEDFPQIERSTDVEHYQAGSMEYDPFIVEDLLTAYLRCGTISDLVEFTSRIIQDEFAPRLGLFRDLDAQRFLDELVSACVDRYPDMEGNQRVSFPQLLLNPLVGILYSQDHNHLNLNLSGIPMVPSLVANHLSGTKRNPLSLHCQLGPTHLRDTQYNATEVGWESQHLHLQLEGGAETVGTKSTHCDFTVDGDVGYLGVRGATGSVFRLASVEEVLHNTTYRAKVGLAGDASAEVERWIKFQGAEGRFDTYLGEGFYENGNTLLILDGKGGWKEVTP